MAGLTTQEKVAINALDTLARCWPDSLTLASMGGSLVVVRTDDKQFESESGLERQKAVIYQAVGIPNTGGDW